MPQDSIEDLRDTLDVPVAGDQWTSPDLVAARAKLGLGPEIRASGNGAPDAVAVCSDLAPQGGLTAAYGEFAKVLIAVVDRVLAAEKAQATNAKALVAIAGLLKGDHRFPESEVPDKTDDKEDDGSEVDKSGAPRILNIGNVPALMAHLGRQPAEAMARHRI
jgi:hypothetical protein